MSTWMCSQGVGGHRRDCRGGGGPVFPLKRQAVQSFTIFVSLSIPGHRSKPLQRCFTFTMPRLPLCAIDRIPVLRVLGTPVQSPRATQTSFQQDSSSLTRLNSTSFSGTFKGQPSRMKVRSCESVGSWAEASWRCGRGTVS